MTTYKIRTTSLLIWLATLLSILLGIPLLLSSLIPKNNTAILFTVGMLFLLVNYLQRFTSRGELEISFMEGMVSIKWLKQFIFHNAPDKKILLNEIESYKYQPDRNFDLFKLTLKDGTEIIIWHSNFFSKDDFKNLVSDFPKIIDQNKHDRNIPESNSIQNIKKEKTIYETQNGIILAIFAAACIIIFTYMILANKLRHTYDFFPILGAISGSAYFLSQVIKYRKQKRKNKK